MTMSRVLAVLACALHAQPALANPTGPAVVSGTAAIATSGSTLTVANSPGTIINWQGFSIGAGETTRFTQQSAQSSVLNRVTSQDPSTILGRLESNGRVVLINQNGIAFAPGATVDVAGLVASSLQLSDADFLSGRMRFSATPGVNAGGVSVSGASFRIGPGGLHMIGPADMVFGVGSSVEIANAGTPGVSALLTTDAANSVLQAAQSNPRPVNIFSGLLTPNVGATLGANTATVGADGIVRFTSTPLATGTVPSLFTVP